MSVEWPALRGDLVGFTSHTDGDVVISADLAPTCNYVIRTVKYLQCWKFLMSWVLIIYVSHMYNLLALKDLLIIKR